MYSPQVLAFKPDPSRIFVTCKKSLGILEVRGHQARFTISMQPDRGSCEEGMPIKKGAMMRKSDTILFEDVKTALRRGEDLRLENHGGWCVCVSSSDSLSRYVVDENCDYQPVPYQKIKFLSSSRQHVRSLNTFNP